MVPDPLARKLGRKLCLSPDEMQMLADLAQKQLRRLSARQDIYVEGDHDSSIRIILDGWAYRYHQFENGTRQIVQILLPGDILGHDMAQNQSDHSACSISPILFAQISLGEMRAAEALFPHIGEALRKDLGMVLAIQRQWIAVLGRLDATQRIAHLLCELYVRSLQMEDDHKGGIVFPMAQRDVADCTGLSLVQVNRSINLLRSEGLMYWRHRALEIPDMSRLAKRGLFNPLYLGHWEPQSHIGHGRNSGGVAQSGQPHLPLFR